MKTKKNQHVPVILKLITFLPVIIFVLLAVNSCAAKKRTATVQTEIPAPPPPPPPPPPPSYENKNTQAVPGEEEPFVVVEQMPEFPGGSEALLKFIAENTRYPELAKKNKIQGKVIIRFCVTAKGGISRVSILKGVAPELDAEAERVAETLPEFIPGKQGGVAVAVWYMLPIAFTLK